MPFGMRLSVSTKSQFLKNAVVIALRKAEKHNFTIPQSGCRRNIENIYTSAKQPLLLDTSIHLKYFPAILNQTLINFPHENKKCLGNNKTQGNYYDHIVLELRQFIGLFVIGGRMWYHTVGKWVRNIGNPAQIFLIKSDKPAKLGF